MKNTKYLIMAALIAASTSVFSITPDELLVVENEYWDCDFIITQVIPDISIMESCDMTATILYKEKFNRSPDLFAEWHNKHKDMQRLIRKSRITNKGKTI